MRSAPPDEQRAADHPDPIGCSGDPPRYGGVGVQDGLGAADRFLAAHVGRFQAGRSTARTRHRHWGTAWLLDGMDAAARLETVDCDEACVAVAQKHLGRDPRVAFHVADGAEFLRAQAGQHFDFIFADTWPGKFSALEAALSLLALGGFYVIDDLLPQTSWPEGHSVKLPPLIAALESRPDLSCTRLAWATGIMVAVKRA
jgi:hypothetical protein